jgi:hypothetical protein
MPPLSRTPLLALGRRPCRVQTHSHGRASNTAAPRRFASSHPGAAHQPGTVPGYAKAAAVLGAGLALSAFLFRNRPTRPTSRDAHPASSPPPASSSSKAAETSTVPAADPPAQAAVPPIDADALAKELRHALGDADGAQDKVSTDPEVLHLHGWSDNDYHPGASAACLLLSVR